MDTENLVSVAYSAFGSEPLSTLEELILRRSLQGNRYSQMASEAGYDDSYVRKVGKGLWERLSRCLGVEVTKSNVLAVLHQYSRTISQDPSTSKSTVVDEDTPLSDEWSIPSLYRQNFEQRHGMIKSLGMSRPVALDQCYAPVTVLDAVVRHYFETFSSLESLYRQRDGLSREDPFNHTDPHERLEGIHLANQEPFLTVLGRPGMGKTTLLKRLGLAALRGKGVDGFEHDCLPVFIELRVFRDQELNLEQQIIRELEICGYPDPQKHLQNLLTQGRLLLLLDGLDEVLPKQLHLITDHIRDFVDQYSLNRFVISCRTTAYQNTLSRFFSVLISDFDEKQAYQLTIQWFQDQSIKGAQCWQAIQENEAARSFVYSPLLLTLLFMIYKQTKVFPAKRALLYEKGLQVLLRDWNRETKRIGYDVLNARSRELLLAELAFYGTKKNQIFFSHKSLIRQIERFIDRTLFVSVDIDATDILQDIESQHGVLIESSKYQFRFVHLSFQEYLTASHIVEEEDPSFLEELVNTHLIDPQWGEIWVLLTELMDEPVALFSAMEKRAQSFLTPELRKLIRWCDYFTTETISSDYEPATRRNSFLYFTLVLMYLEYRANEHQLFLPISLSLAHLLSLELGMPLDVRKICDVTRDFNSLLGIEDSDGSSFTQALSTLLERELSVSFEMVELIDMAFARKAEQQDRYHKERYRDIMICSAFAHEFHRTKLLGPDFTSRVIQILEDLEKHLPPINASQEEQRRYAAVVTRSFHQDLNIPFDRLSLEQQDISTLEGYLISHRVMHKCYQACYQSPTLLWQRINQQMIVPPQD